MSKFKTYAKSIIIPLLVGTIVGILISGSMDYNSLEKPFLSPPSIVFPIVWTILYTLMGISYGILKSNSLVDSKIDSIYDDPDGTLNLSITEGKINKILITGHEKTKEYVFKFC